jgi:hypothetical protein
MPPARRKAPLSRTQILAGFIDKTLLPDLRARATEPAVAETLRARWDFERAHKRTAAALPEWTDQTLTQVAVAWVLSCVFVRVLEDRALVPHARLAGRDARDSEALFYEQFSRLGARDYVLTVFTELARSPVTEHLLGPSINPAWTLGPSHDAVRALLTLLRETHADGALTLRFDDPDTRFLGDLYQDLSADVRERFALLQTPDFVETFILDHTLEPAIATFPLASLRVIDPTCGSGHFLLGALRRIFAHLRAQRPDDDPRALVADALAKVYGSDINPYAVAVARFRLLLDVIALGNYTRLADAPALPALTRNVVVADSLYLGGEKSRELSERAHDAASQSGWGPRPFDFQDPPSVNAVFSQYFHAVVGNPPYITCKDSALRDAYRERYPDSAQKQYALAAPFTERFFQLAVEDGYVGLINANSFMKREFGKGLIEKVLKHRDLTHVVDTSGAYIPGHGTPTVILFGRKRAPSSPSLRAVLGRRGEPETPDDPMKGKVWSSIAGHLGDAGFENEFVTITDADRTTFNKHPWSLGGGGSGDLKDFIEGRCKSRLVGLVSSIGRTNVCGEDDAWIYPNGTHERHVPASSMVTFVFGECVRDWSVAAETKIIYPYNGLGGEAVDPSSLIATHVLWPVRATLRARTVFGKRVEERGRWYEHLEHYADRLKTPLAICFPFVSTHNHFVLDRGGKVFKQTSPIIKLPATATEEDHLALLAWLNSSTACFWMKQVCFPKMTGTNVGDVRGQEDRIAYEFAGAMIEKLPTPKADPFMTSIARAIDELGVRRSSLSPSQVLAGFNDDSTTRIREHLQRLESEDDLYFHRMVALQEELDWRWYVALGIADVGLLAPETWLSDARFHLEPTQRPFLNDSLIPSGHLLAGVCALRRAAIAKSPTLAILESKLHKRPWFGVQGVFHRDGWTYGERAKQALREVLLDRIESVVREAGEAPLGLAEIANGLRAIKGSEAMVDFLTGHDGADLESFCRDLLDAEAIPYLAAMRHTDEGLAKRARWEHTWDLQRREDLGESVGEIPVPPKYDREEYRDPRYWSLRGKLDVPRERFIAYPGAETDPKAPLFGWAGWDHLQRAKALASVYQQRKTLDGWDAPRLLPLLAGLRELLFWITLWHDAPDPDLDGARAGQVWAEFLEGERAYVGCSEDDLRAWRPAAKVRKGRAKG